MPPSILLPGTCYLRALPVSLSVPRALLCVASATKGLLGCPPRVVPPARDGPQIKREEVHSSPAPSPAHGTCCSSCPNSPLPSGGNGGGCSFRWPLGPKWKKEMGKGWASQKTQSRNISSFGTRKPPAMSVLAPKKEPWPGGSGELRPCARCVTPD